MYSHGNHVTDLQLLEDAIHALRNYTEASARVTPFPGWTRPAGSTVLDQEMGLLAAHRERILDALRTDPD